MATRKLIPDAQLEELVRELNQRAEGEQIATESATDDPGAPKASAPLEKYLEEMAQRGASDLLLVAGSPPVYRVGGALVRGESGPFGNDEMKDLFAGITTPRINRIVADRGAVDFSLKLANLRFRVNLHRQRGSLAAAVRALPAEIPTIAQLNLPAALTELVKPAHGLVLVCGPTGAGKSTTLAALIGEINRNEARHIITIEDPVEYEHRNVKSVIEQVEIGRDSPGFADALRAALRQDPDVILVGEMRDLETVATAVTAAETGHLILSTLHTSDVAQAVNRIIDVFPPEQQNQIRDQLSLALNAIVVQHLIPTSGGRGPAVAIELLLANQAVRNHIRHNKLQNLANELTLGKRAGMISLEESLAKLVQQGLISAEDARARSSRPDELASLMGIRGL